MPDFDDYLMDLMLGNLHEAERSLTADREDFTFPTARPQWAPPRHFEVEHVLLNWRVDLSSRRIDASAKLRIRSIRPGLVTVRLHAAELDIVSVRGGSGQDLMFEMHPEEESMTVSLARPLNEGSTGDILFEYRIVEPRAGVFFTGPCPEFPETELSMWTQFQDDYARYAFPIYDNPSHKFTAEVSITVPLGYWAISNGHLKERTENDDGTVTFHWVQDRPVPAYLISAWVSEAEEYCDDLDDLQVRYYAHPKWDRETVFRSFGKTPAMIRFFEEKLGVKFPWAKYAQVTAANFIFGGMENVSATTQTDATLHDEKAHLDFDSDGLVSHELAHQWGGDLVTCRTWSHGWLNEGWATQMQNEWKRHDKGDDEYLYEQYQKQVSYFREDKERYRRPVVCNTWERGSDVFDSHLYPGGAWRYYMLKHLVGERRWWHVLGEYLRKYSFKSVYTHDLERTFTEITGEDFGWFFEQWLYKAGYPECKIKCTYDEDASLVHVRVEQTQKHDDGMTPEVFRFPLTVEIVHSDGTRERHTTQACERVHDFYYPAPGRPSQIVIDPDYAVLMDWDIDKPEDMWTEQLKKGTNVVQRIKAAQALAKKPTPAALKALGDALVNDPFWGVQVEVAKALGSVKTRSALEQLLRGIGLPSSRARTGVARALGEFYQEEQAFEALMQLLHDTESYFVPAAAAHALGKIQHGRSFEVLIDGLASVRPSWHHIIKQGYLQGIAATEKEEAIPVLLDHLKAGQPDELRRVIPMLLAKLGRRYKDNHPEVKDVLVRLIDDRSFRVRAAALLAAKEYEDPSLVSSLQRVAAAEVEGRFVRLSREAIRSLSKKREKVEVESLRKTVEDLEKETRELKDRLARLEFLVRQDEGTDD